MAQQGHGVDITLIAAADLSAKQFKAVKVDSAGKAAVAGVGDFAVGVLQNDPAAGQAATVRILGETKMVSGGTIAAGALIKADANGDALTAVLGATNTSDAGVSADPLIGSNVLGIALVGAADNDIMTVLLTHSGAVPTTNA